jgi:hypothetical protein
MNPTQLCILDQFMSTFHPFQKGEIFPPIELHRHFVAWITINPESRPVKYISFFQGRNDQTKAPLKYYLDNVLRLRRNSKTHQYWIKNKKEECRVNKYFIDRGLSK